MNPPVGLNRRAFLAGSASLLLLAACSSDDDGDVASPSGSDAEPSASETPSTAAFPVSIEHAYGTAEIEKAPTRVVAIGYQEQDSIFALGVTPIAARYWFGDEENIVFPWAESKAGSGEIEILNMVDGIEVEKIAALRPDLILGIYSDLDQNIYDRLSKIAPTIGKRKGDIDYGTPWDVQLEMTGKALGKSELATELADDLKARLADVKDAHPEWAGKEVVIATFSPEFGLGAFASQDPRSRFFQALGFVTPKEIDDAAGDSFSAEISKEKSSLLDHDLLVWDQLSYTNGGRKTIDDDPVFSKLQAMDDGRVVYTEGDMEDAFGFNSILSLPFVLDQIVPLIEEALGDASAESSPSASPTS